MSTTVPYSVRRLGLARHGHVRDELMAPCSVKDIHTIHAHMHDLFTLDTYNEL